jgi:parallel beta-helix repeat protein
MTLADSHDIRIEGIVVRHSQPLGTYACEGSVISAQSVTGLVISRCELAGSGSIAVDLSGCEDIEVSDCFIHDNTFAAFQLTDVASITIAGNRVQRNAATMYSAGVSGLTMAGNTVSDNGSWR